MKLTFHLSSKNVCGGIASVCVVALAYIPLAVPPDHWAWMRWSVIVIGCGAAAVFALAYQALIQSGEDAERDDRELARDATLSELQKNSGRSSEQIAARSSNAITRSLPHAPGTFDSKNFFRMAYLSSLQDVAANSFREEADRVRPENKESFYLDLLATGSIQMMYDELWWISYRSQLRALSALNAAHGLLPMARFRETFDEAAVEFATDYDRLKINFEDWLKYMKANTLLTVHASEMVEITLKGKDFLKYLLHNGRSEKDKRL